MFPPAPVLGYSPSANRRVARLAGRGTRAAWQNVVLEFAMVYAYTSTEEAAGDKRTWDREEFQG